MKNRALQQRLGFLGAAGFLLSGCPDVCDDPVSYEVLEPSLGTREATLSWLQTGVETQLLLTTTAASPATPESCRPAVEVTYAIASSDGAIDESIRRWEDVKPDGAFRSTSLSLSIEAERALQAGVAPELPDWRDRLPRFTLVLPREGGSFGVGEVRGVLGQDDVTLAVITFGAAP